MVNRAGQDHRGIQVALSSAAWTLKIANTHHCEVSGIAFDESTGDEGDGGPRGKKTNRRPFRKSLDRRDPLGGYTDDNCRVVCSAVNGALGDYGDDVLLSICLSTVAKRMQEGDATAVSRMCNKLRMLGCPIPAGWRPLIQVDARGVVTIVDAGGVAAEATKEERLARRDKRAKASSYSRGLAAAAARKARTFPAPQRCSAPRPVVPGGVADRVLSKLRAGSGMYVGSLREFSLVLGGSKSATGAALAGLERDGLIVRVAASHGKGSAIKLVAA